VYSPDDEDTDGNQNNNNNNNRYLLINVLDQQLDGQ